MTDGRVVSKGWIFRLVCRMFNHAPQIKHDWLYCRRCEHWKP